MKTILNFAKTKELALLISREQRNGRFTRVSKKWLMDIDAAARLLVENRVKRHPSLGKTLLG